MENQKQESVVRKGARKNDPFMSRIRISYVFALFLILLLIVCALIIVGSYSSQKSLNDMQNLSVEYAEGKDAIRELMDASDFLTREARLFVVSGNPENGHAYEQEVKVTKRRERALQKIKSFDAADKLYASLENALKESNGLTKTEYYAMHLAAVGFGLKEAEYEEFIGESVLTRSDQALSAEEKKEKAVDLVFSKEYESKKERIVTNVSESLAHLDEELEGREIDSYKRANFLNKVEHALFVIVLIASLFMLWATAVMIVIPIKESTKYIMDNKPLPTKGSAEYFTLAEAYNRMLKIAKSDREKLSYDATHDELTGLYNRKVFEDKRLEFADSDTAMIIVDVDHFKEVNDTYGHEAGDIVLKKVGSLLLSSFRLEDYVCRIGGDEFAIIMVDVDSSLKHVVKNKIEMVRKKLLASDELPNATLSIGVAFSTDEGPEDNLFKKADKALYSVKEKGRDSYRFYSDMNENN